MESWVIDENYIKRILKNRERILKNINDRRTNIAERIRSTEEYLNMFLTSHHNDGIKSKNYIFDSTFAAVVKREESGKREYLLQLQSEFSELIKQEEEIERVCICFNLLSNIYPSGYNAVYELSFKNGYKDKTVDGYAAEHHISKATLVTLRNTVIAAIKFIFEQEYSTRQLMGLSRKEVEEILECEPKLKKAIEREQI